METVGMFNAKTHLPEIIRRVEKGEEICLTNRNKPVAMIVPMDQYYHKKNKDIFAQLSRLQKLAPIGSIEEIIEMRDEGRK